jgi:hypothetical protein
MPQTIISYMVKTDGFELTSPHDRQGNLPSNQTISEWLGARVWPAKRSCGRRNDLARPELHGALHKANEFASIAVYIGAPAVCGRSNDPIQRCGSFVW